MTGLPLEIGIAGLGEGCADFRDWLLARNDSTKEDWALAFPF